MSMLKPKRIFCMSDSHGYPFKKIKKMLQEIDFSDDDYLYILGDTIDRGNGEEMLKLLRLIISSPNIELLMGNHERFALDNACLFEYPRNDLNELSIAQDRQYRIWMQNGGEPTLEMLRRISSAEVQKILNLFRNAPLYKEVDIGEKHFVLCHSGLGGYQPCRPLSLYLEAELLWYRPELNESFWLGENSKVVFGHTPTVFLDKNNNGTPIITSTFIDIDTGAALGEGFAPCIFCLNTFEFVKPD